MATTTKIKYSIDKLDGWAIFTYLLTRLYKKYIVPNAVLLWSTLAVAEATYILIR